MALFTNRDWSSLKIVIGESTGFVNKFNTFMNWLSGLLDEIQTASNTMAESEQNAAESAASAHDWAVSLSEVDVDNAPGLHGARYYAQQAQSVVLGQVLDDSQASTTLGWTGAKIQQEIGAVLPSRANKAGMGLITDGESLYWGVVDSNAAAPEYHTSGVTLTASSSAHHIFQGSPPWVQEVVLPDATQLTESVFAYRIVNDTEQPLAVLDAEGGRVALLSPGMADHILLEDTATAAGQWRTVMGVDQGAFMSDLLTDDLLFDTGDHIKPGVPVSLDDDRLLHIYSGSSPAEKPSACVIKRTGAGEFTTGSDLAVGDQSYVGNVAATLLDTDKVLYVYPGGSSSDFTHARVLNVNDLYVSQGTPRQVFGVKSGNQNYYGHAVAPISSTQALVLMAQASAWLHAMVVDIDGTTITLNTHHTKTDVYCVNNIDVATVSASEFLVVHGILGGTMNAMVATVSGTDVAYGDPLNLPLAEYAELSLYTLGAGRFLLLSREDSGARIARILAVSGGVVTEVSSVELPGMVTGRMTAAQVSATGWLVSDQRGCSVVLQINGDVLTVRGQQAGTDYDVAIGGFNGSPDVYRARRETNDAMVSFHRVYV